MTRQRLRLYGTLGGLLVALSLMVTLVSYSATLYRIFCEVTGAGGTTQRAALDDARQAEQVVRVRFFTHVAPDLKWRFQPAQDHVDVHLGEDALVFFEAENTSDQDVVSHATFNVTPDAAGSYFKKIECFCFTEEKLAAHTKVEMPVEFFVDPRFADDHDLAGVRNITLSYTFFTSLNPTGAPDLARFEDAAEVGEQAFSDNCRGCHAIDRNQAGPTLSAVIGRIAGTVPGYPYSEALARSHIVWSPNTLDRWLTNPQGLVPGALMPMSVADPQRRRDIIAYLQKLQAPASRSAATTPPA